MKQKNVWMLVLLLLTVTACFDPDPTEKDAIGTFVSDEGVILQLNAD